MRKHILPLDSGMYGAAKAAGLHALPWLTKQVVEKLSADGKDHLGRDIDVVADMKAHVARTMKRLHAEDDGSTRSESALEYAVDSYGFHKEMEARGINVRRDTGRKFFEVTANTPLFPQFIATTFIESRINAGLIGQMCFADIQVDRASFDKVRLTDSADDTELRWVEIGGDLPTTELSQIGTNVKLRKYGRRFLYARETMELTPLAVVAAYIGRIARRLASNETDEALEVLHAGDGEAGSAVVDTTPATNGALVYNDLVTLEMAFADAYAGDVYVADANNFQTMLKMAEYKDPLAKRDMQRINGLPSVLTPAGAGRIFRWSTGRSSYMAEAGGRVAGVDSSTACYCIRRGDILEEQATIVSSGKIEVALSYLFACVKGDPAAFHSLDVTA